MEPTATKKIVIVEDNQALAEIYKTRLELLGYTVFIGYNGITGLYFIQSEQPDLVLLDIMIPDIAGDQVLRTMRSSEWGQAIPAVIMSNLNEAEAPAGLRELGIVDYVVKANMQDDTLDQIVQKVFSSDDTSTGVRLTSADAPVASYAEIPVEEPPAEEEKAD